jgi:thiamine biosynthesis lipoprotein
MTCIAREFRAMGTDWWLRSEHADTALLDQAERMVADFERRLSRFLPESSLSRLNRERRVDDSIVAQVVLAAEELRHLTSGAFDARSGAAVIAAGYDRDFATVRTVATVAPDIQRPRVTVDGTSVTLSGDGTLDLGGIAKGWTVDRVADLLGEAGPCLVDGGGDIAVRGQPHDAAEWVLGAGDDVAVGLFDASVATSSTLRRRWRAQNGELAHHIIDPQCAMPACGMQTAVVVARNTALADALATALVADAARSLHALPVVGADAMLQHADGRWEMTSGMGRYLR